MLREHGYTVIRRPADYDEHDTARAAIFLHFDGSTAPCGSGASVGFPDTTSRAFVDAWESSYRAWFPYRFVGENFTENEHKYYGFRKVDAPEKLLDRVRRDDVPRAVRVDAAAPARARRPPRRLPDASRFRDEARGVPGRRGGARRGAAARARRRSARSTCRTSSTASPASTGVVVRTMGDDPPLVSIRGNERFAAASVIKLAILATVYRAYDAGTAKPRGHGAHARGRSDRRLRRARRLGARQGLDDRLAGATR